LIDPTDRSHHIYTYVHTNIIRTFRLWICMSVYIHIYTYICIHICLHLSIFFLKAKHVYMYTYLMRSRLPHLWKTSLSSCWRPPYTDIQTYIQICTNMYIYIRAYYIFERRTHDLVEGYHIRMHVHIYTCIWTHLSYHWKTRPFSCWMPSCPCRQIVSGKNSKKSALTSCYVVHLLRADFYTSWRNLEDRLPCLCRQISCVCLYFCISVFLYVCMYVCMYICMYIFRIYVCIHVCIFVCMYACMHIHK